MKKFDDEEKGSERASLGKRGEGINKEIQLIINH